MDVLGKDLEPVPALLRGTVGVIPVGLRHWLDLATGQNPGWYPGEYAHLDKNSVKDSNVC